MPSKLVAIHDAPSGCELELVDRSRIALNVTHETVRNYVIRDGFRDLKSFVDAKRIDVYFQPVAISMTEWGTYSRLVRNSGVAQPVVWWHRLRGRRPATSLLHFADRGFPARQSSWCGLVPLGILVRWLHVA